MDLTDDFYEFLEKYELAKSELVTSISFWSVRLAEISTHLRVIPSLKSNFKSLTKRRLKQWKKLCRGVGRFSLEGGGKYYNDY